MRVVEVRRHTERDQEERLTANGREIAAKACESLDLPYEAYYVSPRARARLTMAAFGISDAVVHEGLSPRPRPEFAPYDSRHEALMAQGIDAVTAWYAIRECEPLLLEHGRTVLATVLEIAANLAEGGRALAVSHGGTIEPLAVAATCRPYAHLFGTAELGYCEGVRAHVREGAIRRLDVVRLPL